MTDLRNLEPEVGTYMRLISVTLLCLFPIMVPGQTQLPARSFEVASIKPVQSGGGNTSFEPEPTGLTIRNATIRGLMVLAYHLRAGQITGGPGWIDEDRFDVIAKNSTPASRDDLLLMLRQLLVDRFKLSTHESQKAMRVYLLELDQNASKLIESKESGELSCDQPKMANNLRQITCRRVGMAKLAEMLPALAPAFINLPVVDRTELTGQFDVTLSWAPARKDSSGEWVADDDAASKRTVFDSLSSLGLKLEAASSPMPILVVDHIDRTPTEN